MPDNQLPPTNNSGKPFVGPSYELLYANQPPEVNSGNIYQGQGSAPLHKLARCFHGVADRMFRLHVRFEEWDVALKAHWSGPAATQVATTAAELDAWLSVFIKEAQTAGWQITKIAQAYDEARNAMQPPEAITINRAQRDLLALRQTSGLERHDEAIAVLDREYDQFWAADVAAMRSYEVAVRTALANMPSWQAQPRRALAIVRKCGG